MKEGNGRTFEDLEAWKSARELRVFVFREIAPTLLKLREYPPLDQVKRSSRSVGNNIAEGHGRFHFRDNYKFCPNARGSLSETLDHLVIRGDDELIDPETISRGRAFCDQTLRILNGYMLWLKKSAESSSSK